MNLPNDTHKIAAVQIEGVSVLRGERTILQNVTWRISPGEQAAVLGPNGSGKSTLVRILLGYLWPTRGNVIVVGRKFGEANLHELRTVVRLVQSNGPFEVDPVLTAEQVIFTGFEGTLGAYGTPTVPQWELISRLIDRVGLQRARKTTFGLLSSGERVRALLARALVTKPQVLILDEPTAGLDIRGREEFLALIEDLGSQVDRPAIITVTHHVEELSRKTSNILLLDQGTTAAIGGFETVLRPELLSKVYDCAVDVRQIDCRYYLHARSREWLAGLRAKGRT